MKTESNNKNMLTKISNEIKPIIEVKIIKKNDKKIKVSASIYYFII